MMTSLNDVKIGDTIALKTGWHSTGFHSGYRIYEPAIVEKVTANEITVRKMRFLKRNGDRIGGSKYSIREFEIKAWTPEMEREIEETRLAIEEDKLRRDLLATIDKTQFKYLPTGKLQAIVYILEATNE